MSGERLLSFANRWFTTSVGLTVAILLLSVLTGFVLLPYASPDSRLTGLWDSICSAAGFPVRRSAGDVIALDFAVSSAKLNETILRNPPAESIGRGATLAQQCAICHGPTGISRADSPNLAGQYAAVIYKQLHDFKTGARVNTVMSPFAIHMSEQDMLDLAAYYSYLPSLPESGAKTVEPVPTIVASGAPMRGIAPCGSCHGGIETKEGSPWLNGQSAVYVKSQLHAFAASARRNDTSQQMRNIARAMTEDEIDAAAKYYSSLQ
ncbi:cytochrome C [Rhizobium sp. Root708]|uniref:c-type cytochrome n=1 Tax=Rhizobium sp. Root708 TaxID=1736592 RepID=UPI0006F2097F|nr:c-type cytochrome [Rhizobium sp. Root708]KRB50703.1 cytochrome C [Rhizobium sp. Root708]